MPTSTQIGADPAKSIAIDMSVTTMHVVSSRVWVKPPGGVWALVHDGDFRFHEPDDFTLPAQPAGTVLHYWLGIGGNPSTQFSVVISLRQDGPLPGGTHLNQGMTDADGKFFVQDEVAL